MKHRAANALSRLQTTGMDEFPLEDDVPVLEITNGQPEEENTEKHAKFLHSLPGNEGLESVKPALPKVLQVSSSAEKGRSLMTKKLLTGQANDHYCREVANAVGRQGPLQSYHRNGVSIRQGRIDGPLPKFLPTLLRSSIPKSV